MKQFLKEKKVYVLAITIALLMVITITFSSYAYFAATTNSSDINNTAVTTGSMEIEFSDGPQVSLENAVPGSYVEKTFTIRNVGSKDTAYDIYFGDLVNTFVDINDLKYTITSSSGASVAQTTMPTTTSKVVSNQPLPINETHSYTLRIDFIETNDNQDDNKDKTFSTTIMVNEDGVNSLCSGLIGQEYTYEYTGNIQEFRVQCDGYYKLETWGAQGGTLNSQFKGGYGAYSTGHALLTRDNLLYIVVGGVGTNTTKGNYTRAGGYNGGGSGTGGASDSWSGAGGGGATHIAFKSGVLSTLSAYKGNMNLNNTTYNSSDILIVSGGGGGAGCESYAGNAGGISGGNGVNNRAGGTQTTGCSFGTGCNGAARKKNWGSGGGGGGWFGGNGGTTGSYGGSGAGGSSYIGSDKLISYSDEEKHMVCYNCSTSNEEDTKTISTTNVSSTPTSDYAKTGSGYAKITYLGNN